jgi:Phage tail tube protein
MPASHGKNAVVQLDNGAGTLAAITAYLSKASLERMRETAETTVLGVNDKTYVVGLKDATFSGEGNFDPPLDLILSDDIGDNTNTKTLQYDPQGSTTGLPRYSFECWVTKYSIETDIGDKASCSFELQGTGAVTRSTIP